MYVPLTVGCRQLCSTWYGCHTKVIRIKIHGLLILFAKTTIVRESAKLYCFCAPQFTSISEFTFGVIAAFHIRTFPGPISKRLIDIIYLEVGLIECSFVPALTLKLNCVLSKVWQEALLWRIVFMSKSLWSGLIKCVHAFMLINVQGVILLYF